MITINKPPVRVDSGLVAEILDQPASWHIARIAPGREYTAAGHFERRRFAIYLPQFDTWEANTLTKRTPLFPGYVFIFLWGLSAHIDRVKAVPGVLGLLTDGTGRPLTVPDLVIRQIDDVEWKVWLSHLPRSYFRRRRQHEQWIIPRWSSLNRGFVSPDPDVRLAALHRALGLTASPPEVILTTLANR